VKLDSISIAICDLLADDARLSFRELGERVGLSPPAVADRVRRLEAAGVLVGFRAVLDPEKVGFPILAVIRLKASFRDAEVDDLIGSLPEVVECLRVTGSDSHVIRARVRSTAHLEDLLRRLGEHGETETHIVTSSPVPTRCLRLADVLGP
jgi:Lrp/AsnC family transcriptional regulator, leucine-responsive regulatory protein